MASSAGSGSPTNTTSKQTSAISWMAMSQSPIGKKLLTGVTGLGLVTFLIIHMAGNLVFFVSADAYNRYAYRLEQLAPLVWTVEGLLLTGIIIHTMIGLQIYLNKRQARKSQYDTYQSAGNPSRQTISSRTMIWTGGLLAAFILWHILTFKFGPHYSISTVSPASPISLRVNDVANSMSTMGPTRDLSRLVLEAFRQPLYTWSYTGFLAVLGFHLRHGIWSAFQSLGLLNKVSSVGMATVGGVVAIAITLGFLALPWAIYLDWIR